MESKADTISKKATSLGATNRGRTKATNNKKPRKANVTKMKKLANKKATSKTRQLPAKAATANSKKEESILQKGPALRLTNVAIMRGERLIQQTINHEMAPGQMTLLTGPNGSGKSSLLRAISGRLTKVRGSISCTVPIVYVGHQDGVSGVLSGRQNLVSWAGMNDVVNAQNRIEDAIGELNAVPFAALPIRLLSRGQRRRFALARLLLGPPGALWLLDEPSVGLDIDTMQILDSIISKHLSCGGLVLAATHLPLAPFAHPEVLALSDRADDRTKEMLASQKTSEAGDSVSTKDGEQVT